MTHPLAVLGACTGGASVGGTGLRGVRVGEASHPGPKADRLISSINLTSLFGNIELAANIGSSLIAIQEHSVPSHLINQACAKCAGLGYKLIASPSIQSGTRSYAGTGFMVHKHIPSLAPEPRSDAFAFWMAHGRASLAVVTLGANLPLLAMSLYGFASDEPGVTKIQATADIFDAAIQEARHWPSMPCIMCADVNAPPTKVPFLSQELEQGGLIDLGMAAPAWGGLAGVPTALAHGGASRPSRIDCMFANRDLMRQITSFRVLPRGTFDVHSVITASVKVDSVVRVRTLCRALPIEKAQQREREDRHVLMDVRLNAIAAKLQECLSSQHMDAFYTMWSRAVEAPLVQAGPSPSALARGTVSFKSAPPLGRSRFHPNQRSLALHFKVPTCLSMVVHCLQPGPSPKLFI